MSNNRHEHLMNQLRSAPVQKVQGVVGASGVGASHSRGDAMWSMTFSLAAWCREGGPVCNTKLIVRRDIQEDELAGYRSLLPTYSVVSLDVGLVEESDFDAAGKPQALLHAITPGATCRSDLIQLASVLQEPLVTEDTQFGKFTLDRRVNWHKAQTVWGELAVRLSLDSSEDSDVLPEDSLSCARKLWSEVPRWSREVRDAIIRELLGLKNDNWLGDDEQPLSEDQFWSSLTLESITVRGDGSFEFWFDDGDTFWGHSIMASGSFEEGITDAGIHG